MLDRFYSLSIETITDIFLFKEILVNQLNLQRNL